MSNQIARVLVASQAPSLDRLFDYRIPAEFQDAVQIGARVIVPFQKRPSLGFLWELADYSEFPNLKEIRELLDDPPLIGKIQYQLINWLADYNFCSRLEVVKLCLPPGANLSREAYYRLTVPADQLKEILAAVFPADEVAAVLELVSLGTKTGWNAAGWQRKFQELPKVFEFLTDRGLLVRSYRIAKPKTKAKTSKVYRWVFPEGEEETAAAGSRVKNVLMTNPMGMTAAEICGAAGVSSTVLKRLLKEGKLRCLELAAERNPAGFEERIIPRQTSLNCEQQTAFQTISTGQEGSLYLLHGVTGSGKTEVYFETAQEILKNGGQVLYLVPEIALTPQTLERARNRFGDQVALIHSNMSDGERFDQWFRVKRGEARLVLGARSAVFAPFTDLKLIIVDEEHESTYKQEENPRYHIRQVVEKLASLTGAKVIFGSATPSVESFYYAQTGKYRYLQLNKRFNRNPLPEVQVVDMREELKNGNKNILSRRLFDSIAGSLANHEQIILLLNRRGHSTFILCRDCGYSLGCPACEVALTYHLTEKTLRCHYCDYRQPVPNQCPKCGSARIRFFGHGTQKLEEELAVYFPEARIVRMDVDSTAKKGAHHQIYQQLTSGAVDILLGTQMIAKGLDLPNVTLVGVISADSILHIPDFRAAERTFQLLTQVAGRTGRGQKPGRVVFQTYDPDHYSLRFAKVHDYRSFYQTEIEFRDKLHYPPFAEMVKFGFSGLNPEKVSKAANSFYLLVEKVRAALSSSERPPLDMEILGPSPALIPKIQNNYRWQLLLKSVQPDRLEQVVKQAWEKYRSLKEPDVKVIKDRHPYLVV